MPTKIAWATETWNPVTGCTPISPGCANCYAKRMAQRLKGRHGYPADDPFSVTLHADKMGQPIQWKSPRKIFISSMGDLFHDDVELRWIDTILTIIDICPQHRFLSLTKRPHNLQEKLYGVTEKRPFRELGGGDYLPNLWLGTSCENQEWADKRIPHLQAISAAVRWLSLEPLLGPINFRWKPYHYQATGETYREYLNRKGSISDHESLSQLNWIVIGAESINGRPGRPCKLEWVESIVGQCKDAGVPVFVKQLEINGRLEHDINKFPKYLQYQEMPDETTR